MKVNWNDIHSADAPGQLSYRDGMITIRQEEIDVWRALT